MALIHYPRFEVIIVAADGYRVAVPGTDFDVHNLTQNQPLGTLQTDEYGIIAAGSFDDTADPAVAGDVIEISHSTYPGKIRFTLQTTSAKAFEDALNDGATLVAENFFTNTLEPEIIEVYATDLSEPDTPPVKIGSGKQGETLRVPYQTSVAKDIRLSLLPVAKEYQFSGGDFRDAEKADLHVPAIVAPTSFVIPVFDEYTDATTSGTSLQTLYSATIPANRLRYVGDKIKLEYGGVLAANANSKAFGLSFGPNKILDFGTTANGKAWAIDAVIIRKNDDSVRCILELTMKGEDPHVEITEYTGYDFTASIALVLAGRTITQAGDMTARLGYGIRLPAYNPDIEPPSVPLVSSFIADSDTELTLTWAASSDNIAVTSYEVRIRTAAGSYGSWTDIGNVLTYQFTGLTASTAYRAQVRARDAAANYSAASTEANATTDAAPLLLDQLSVQPERAFSFRKLRAAYSGPCCKVRTSATSGAYTDIDFDVDGWVDEAAMAAVGSPVYVLFYDQTGNGNHQTQLSSNAIPQVQSNQINSRPGVSGAAYIDHGDLSAFTEGEHFILMKLANDPPSGGDTGALHSFGTDAATNHIPYTDGTVYDGFGSNARKTTVNPTPSFASWRLYSAYSASGDWANYVDGTQIYSTATNTVGFNAAAYIVLEPGCKLAGEHLLFDQKLGSTDRTAIFNDIEAAYGLTF